MNATFNKYSRWYQQIVDRARIRPHANGMERHHILPRAMGGTDAKSNIVSLTYREHFLAHWLLVKFTTGADLLKMKRALWAMTWRSKTHERIVAGWQYEIARAVLPQLGTALGCAGKGRAKTAEHCKRISIALAGLPKTDEHRAKLALHRPSEPQRKRISETSSGRRHSPETVERLRAISTGRKNSPETRAKLSKALAGREFTADWCAKISQGRKGKRVGIPHSPEHREKLAAAARKRLRGPSGRFERTAG